MCLIGLSPAALVVLIGTETPNRSVTITALSGSSGRTQPRRSCLWG
jgi:hypothetical protein